MKNTNQESHINSKYVLVTDTKHDFLLKIFKEECIGKVSLYIDDENNNKINGESKKNKEDGLGFDWEWAHKIYYSYNRLTSLVSKSDQDGYFENVGQERIYIFNCLSKEDIEIIKETSKSHFVMFEVETDKINKIDAIANITHNFYSAWERVMMKYHPFCKGYDEYLKNASIQLNYLKENLLVFGDHSYIVSAIDQQLKNIEAFEHDDEVRSYLLEIYKSHVNIISH